MMTPKKKTGGGGVMIPRSARTGMAKGGMATSVKKKTVTKKASGGGVMIPRSARRTK
jgi:hypothetical protein